MPLPPDDGPALLPDVGAAHSFLLEFDRVAIQFGELSGLKVGKGNLEFAAVRPIRKSDALDAWFKTPKAKNVVVKFVDFEGLEVKRYSVTAAQPKTLENNGVPGETALMTETFVFTYKECKLA
jgi:hypothetical protein